jgi:hypothetical protein
MKHASGIPVLTLVLALAAGAAAEAPGHSHEKCELHGGAVAMTNGRHFETVFAPDGIRVYVYTGNQTPEVVGKGTGTATLSFKDGTTREIPLVAAKPDSGDAAVYFCPMHPEVVQMKPGKCDKCGGMILYTQDYLYAKADLAKVAPGSLKATIRIKGLRGLASEVVYTEPFTGPSASREKSSSTAPKTGASGASHEGHTH